MFKNTSIVPQLKEEKNEKEKYKHHCVVIVIDNLMQ